MRTFLFTLLALCVLVPSAQAQKQGEISVYVGRWCPDEEIILATCGHVFGAQAAFFPLKSIPWIGGAVTGTYRGGSTVDLDKAPLACCGKPAVGGDEGSEVTGTGFALEAMGRFPIAPNLKLYASAGVERTAYDVTGDPDLEESFTGPVMRVALKWFREGTIGIFGAAHGNRHEVARNVRDVDRVQNVDATNAEYVLGATYAFDFARQVPEPEKPAPVPAPEPRPEICRDYPSDILESVLEEGDRWLYFGMGPKDPAALHVVGRHQGQLVLAEHGDAQPFVAIFREDRCEPGQYHEYRPEESIRGTTG